MLVNILEPNLLRTVPTNTEVFLHGFNMTTREKQILAKAIGIQKEN